VGFPRAISRRLSVNRPFSRGLDRRGTAWGILGLAALLLFGAAPAENPVPLRRAELLPERDGVAPGETLSVVLRITLNREFHVNSHVPTQEYLIPTSVEADPPEMAKFAAWTYPEGEMKKFPFSEEPLRVYEGTFLVRGAVLVAPDALVGSRHLSLRLRYQACTTEKCFPPKVEEVPFDFRVVAAGTATRPLHPDLFTASSPGRS
jgi:hypothetical protein